MESPTAPNTVARAPTAESIAGLEELAPAADVLLRGVRVTYTDLGPREAPPVVLLHGIGRDRGQWAGLVRALGRHHRVIAVDLPGFGDSERPSPSRFRYGYEGFAEVALDLVAALGLGRVGLVGHSMGAGAALVAATERPEFVSRLVLVSPPCDGARPPLSERLLMLPLVGGTLFRGPVGRSALRRRGVSTSVPDASLSVLRAGTADAATLEARRPRVRCPTLVVWGREDPVVPWTQGTRLARELGGARLEVLDCGHDPTSERPLAFEAIVTGFLGEESARTGPAIVGERVGERLSTSRRQAITPSATSAKNALGAPNRGGRV